MLRIKKMEKSSSRIIFVKIVKKKTFNILNLSVLHVIIIIFANYVNLIYNIII